MVCACTLAWGDLLAMAPDTCLLPFLPCLGGLLPKGVPRGWGASRGEGEGLLRASTQGSVVDAGDTHAHPRLCCVSGGGTSTPHKRGGTGCHCPCWTRTSPVTMFISPSRMSPLPGVSHALDPHPASWPRAQDETTAAPGVSAPQPSCSSLHGGTIGVTVGCRGEREGRLGKPNWAVGSPTLCSRHQGCPCIPVHTQGCVQDPTIRVAWGARSIRG